MSIFIRNLTLSITFSFLFLSSISHSSPLLDLDRIWIKDQIQYFEDPASEETIDSIQSANIDWQPNGNKVFNKSYNRSRWWLTFSISNQLYETQERLLEIAFPMLDFVNVYVMDGETLVSIYEMGDQLPFYQRPIQYRNFVAPLKWQANQTLKIYISINTLGSVQSPLVLWKKEQFHEDSVNTNILYGIYFGSMLIIAAYNLLIYLIIGDRSYIYYVGFIISLTLTMATVSGHAFNFLWPSFPVFANIAPLIFLPAASIFGAEFTRSFLRVKEFSVALNRIFNACVAISFILLFIAFIFPHDTVQRLQIFLIILLCPLGIAAGFSALKHQRSEARLYLVAWVGLLCGAIILALNKIGVLPANLWAEFSVQMGSMLEALLLSFALAERINSERRLRFEVQSELLHQTQQAKEELERRVVERTTELGDMNQKLEKMNHQLQELSDTDQLTGLRNRRYMEKFISQEWRRCMRYKHSLAIVLIDIDFFKKVNDTKGHQAGDVCLHEVAKLISEGLRWPSDLAARYGGEEYCLVLPETDIESALLVAERVRKNVEKATIIANQEHIELTISAGVYAAIPTKNTSSEEFLRNSDIALYNSKEQGRNRVSTVEH